MLTPFLDAHYFLYELRTMRKANRIIQLTSASGADSRRRFRFLFQLPSHGVTMCNLVGNLSHPPRLSDDYFLSDLPVRGLWLHCNGCSHGGHQHCYRKFYSSVSVSLGPPLTEPPLTARPTRTSTHQPPHLTGASLSSFYSGALPSAIHADGSRKVHGLPCAAVCGHMCFVGDEHLLITPLG
jgi:hypothetical protein